MTQVGQFPYSPGGLMRCCLATLNNHAEDEAAEGMTLACDYEDDDEPKMILDISNRDAQLAWRWIGARSVL